MTRLLVAAGGTGGHIYPGLAIGQAFAARHPDAEVTFVGTDRGLEEKLIGGAGFPVYVLRARPLRGGGLLRKARSALALVPAYRDAKKLLGELDPDAVVGIGGYVSGPIVLAAARRGIPTLIVEPNYEPGLTNRWLGPFIDRAAVAWNDTADHFPGKAFVAGNPIRAEISAVPDVVAAVDCGADKREPAADATGGSTSATDDRRPARLDVLLFGGSQGSVPLNDAMIAALRHLGDDIDVTHQAGTSDLERVRAAYAEAGIEARVEPYFPDIHKEYARCHVVVSRAGATTCAELAAAGRGAILVPLPLAGAHQARNARALEREGAAIVIEQPDLTGEKLAATLNHLAANPARYVEMGKAARAQAKPHATQRIIDELENLLSRPPI